MHTRLFRFIVCRLAQACERGCSVAAASKRGGGRYDYGLDHGDGRLEAPWRGMYKCRRLLLLNVPVLLQREWY